MTRHLSDTLARMAARAQAAVQTAGHAGAGDGNARLESWTPPSRNPGSLAAKVFVPANLPANAPLVVSLHGCTQTAAAYDIGTGWSVLAEREGFALLLPEQGRANNPNLCFNWFQPADFARTGGEAESIALMVRAMIEEHRLDPARVYVTGLSAGGAMAAAMLATWPELFAGGAIIGGLPFGVASTVPEAFDRMRGKGVPGDAALTAAVTRASDHRGPWPTVSIWHGTADNTVSVSNLDAIGRQWRGIHGVSDAPTTESGRGWTHRSWRGSDGRVAVEEWSVAGMGHGVPIDPTGGAQLGQSGPYMLDVGLSSTAAVAASWGLLARDTALGRVQDVTETPQAAPGAAKTMAPSALAPAAARVQQVIENALRGAGLLR